MAAVGLDRELLELWLEAPNGVMRLFSRRAKRPLDLDRGLIDDILVKIEDYLRPER
eukprot:CAMPEP_0119489786 /NCGR_PEP_ID=MMETSP1344-20130328/15146_1 /TAXON_ID=236787 /ORGANISM="Florenciella parvula, Strain CCMP2471" /LENGTH=55 /DNA_ID=CAMNT_0007524875 /DNA_START=15 /DNA_END=179 /DNA_ORIENTATION=-